MALGLIHRRIVDVREVIVVCARVLAASRRSSVGTRGAPTGHLSWVLAPGRLAHGRRNRRRYRGRPAGRRIPERPRSAWLRAARPAGPASSSQGRMFTTLWRGRPCCTSASTGRSSGGSPEVCMTMAGFLASLPNTCWRPEGEAGQDGAGGAPLAPSLHFRGQCAVVGVRRLVRFVGGASRSRLGSDRGVALVVGRRPGFDKWLRPGCRASRPHSACVTSAGIRRCTGPHRSWYQ